MTSVIAVSRISYLLPPSELKMGKREHRPSGNPGKRRKSNLSDPIKFCDIGHPYNDKRLTVGPPTFSHPRHGFSFRLIGFAHAASHHVQHQKNGDVPLPCPRVSRISFRNLR